MGRISRLKEKVTTMNPRKGFCNLILCAVIFFVIAGTGVMVRFGNRIPEMKKQIELTEESERKTKQEHTAEDGGNEHETEWKMSDVLTTGDYVFLGCIAGVFWIILSVYWLYTAAYVISRAWEVGANARVFGLLTFVTNIFGVACLWLYIKLHSICPGCGRIQPKKANNCAVCGAAIYVKCPDCESRISVRDEYCNGCGRKMDR